MTIDISSSLYAEIKRAAAGYNAAIEKCDNTKANQKAKEISALYRELSTMQPALQKEHLDSATEWEKRSHLSLHPQSKQNGRNVKAVATKNRAGKETETTAEDDLSRKAESLTTKSNVTWSDIGGLENVKRLLMETVAIAGLQKPDAVKPWKGVLLFGPPGTGKTLLAAAAAGSLNASFYDVKADSVLSKYFGESSKLISALYSSARQNAPSIVFIDEFDALSQSREGESSEASRKILSSLLTELDGLSDKKSDRLLLTLAATNTPWDMDTAVLSRFPRRIYVPLPDAEAVKGIIQIQTKGMDISNLAIDPLSEKCVEMLYSGRDLTNFCQQAIWTMIHDANPNLHKLAELPFGELREQKLKTRPLNEMDFEEAWKKIRSPLTKSTIEKYEQWNSRCGEL